MWAHTSSTFAPLDRRSTGERAPLSHPTSSIPGDHIYGRIDRQRAAFLSEFLQLAIERCRRCRSSSHIKAVKNNPFMRRRQLCSLPRAHSPTSCYSHTCCSLAKRRRIGERENMQQRTFMAPNFGRRAGARENYGEKLALSPPSLLPPSSALLPE